MKLVIIHWNMIDYLPNVSRNSTTEGVKIKIIGPENEIVKEILTYKNEE